jgi:SAM-dependent methyltransferase
VTAADWWSRFDAVVRAWIRNDAESMAAWATYQASGEFAGLTELARRGQVSADADVRTAMWEAFLYQRGHLNAFRRVLETRLRKAAQKGSTADRWILDLGCGTGTVAFAFSELFRSRARLHYVGQDHHEPSLDVCAEMLDGIVERVDESILFSDMVEAFEAAADQWPDSGYHYVTCSYLLAQDACTDDTARRIAALISELVDRRGRLRLVIADSTWPPSKGGVLIEALRNDPSVEIDTDPEPDVYDYQLAFPALEGRQFRRSLTKKVEGRYLIIDPA